MTEQSSSTQQNQEPPLANAVSFIETQFPVAKLSSESYKERKAGASQTLVGLGNWKGRKPLVLVRAALLGLLLPSTDDLKKDRDIFLKLMTMDDEGLKKRKNKSIPPARIQQELLTLPPYLKNKYSDPSLARERRSELQNLVFERMPYSEKLEYCARPEQINDFSDEDWREINDHLQTDANSLPDLVKQLGKKRFGHLPKVADAFCGGGSVPFEAARLGCEVFASDLNPVATLLTWASLNIIGGGEEVSIEVKKAQQDVYNTVDRQIIEWGIEHNSLGWRADAYLYCVEVLDPSSNKRLPLLPTLAIAPEKNVIAKLNYINENNTYAIEIVENASEAEYKTAEKLATIVNGRVLPPGDNVGTPIDVIRQNMRNWEKKDFCSQPIDAFQERLYCVRWVESYEDNNGNIRTRRHYRAPGIEDLKREEKVIELLSEFFVDWQDNGFIPSRKIESGAKTDEPINTRGWTYWHHLFTPRQLLLFGSLAKVLSEFQTNSRFHKQIKVGLITGLGKCVDLSSKLSRWNYRRGTIEQTLYNQAFNTLYNYASRGFSLLKDHFVKEFPIYDCYESVVYPTDARLINSYANIWITDPPYADAVNYDEISEFFLAWEERHIKRIFPTWPVDSRRELAVRSSGGNFNQSMVDCYRNLTRNMPDNGMQIVMFTHQDSQVWADLSMILWASGLRVSSAWTITTETDASGIRSGNNVQGTVLMVLRKRINNEPLFLDEVSHLVNQAVREQLDTMIKLEDDSDPNFDDSDYQLAAYAAAMRVLTNQPIEEIDPIRSITNPRLPGEVDPVEELIQQAVTIACDHLIPKNLDSTLWKFLNSIERFYIKGLEVESHGEYRNGVYQELARGFGASSYTDLLANTRANETRLKNASEFGRSMLGKFEESQSFGDSLVRICLFAIWQTTKNEDTKDGLNFLHTELKDFYWINRERILGLMEYFSNLRFASSMEQWKKDALAASLLAGAVRNDHV